MTNQIETIRMEYTSPMDSPGFWFWQTFLSWQKQIDVALAPYDLTQPSFSVLAITAWLSAENHRITNQRTVRQKIIIEITKLNKMLVSQLLQRLVGNGLVAVEPYELDRRERLVGLTEKGWDILRKTVVLVENIDRDFLSKVTIDAP
ncbi:MarR family winged helix-turn-helix transcriptional regulator [Pseudovibrio sp. WM33]|uniref:MarR family winged helix-turn-helix transcriptional regulator n=1 Tax=Pseudovibrio sp. WM33 TaxID=1735585 RepID=UPI0007AE96BE|nr:winged helix DNA-binding protein [Pseudovibrio sp. WM33]KZL23787.1 Transcriptional regulator HosA [Pseudovibrio sp. WM33]